MAVPRRGRSVAAAAALGVAILSGCSSEAKPTPPPIAVSLASPVEGRVVSCASCPDVPTLVIDVPVTISDPMGTGGVLAEVTLVALNRSRGGELARNTRPNAEYAFPDASVPAGGQLVVRAGLVAPLPPPRDEISVTVLVRLTDGREASAAAPLQLVVPS
jgi:hypothetical protein